MLIKTLAIENFRGIRNVTAEFEGQGVYLVLGPNGSGKSSFIEAVRWIAEGFTGASWQAELQRMGGFSLCVTRDHEQDAIRCAIGLDSTVDQIMPLGASLPQNLPRLDYRPTIVICASETQFDCVLRAMSIGDSSAEAVLTTFLNQDQSKPWLPNTNLRPFTRFAESLRQFNESGAHTGVEIPVPNGYDLLSFVATLQTGDPAAWERVISAVRSIVPETEVEQVLTPLRPREQSADLFVVERGVGRVPWRLAPTGAKQAVFLAALMVACPDESIIFIEEPECNLHPLAQRRLMSFAIQEAKQHRKQIVFTSHSLEIVDSPGWKRAFVLARSGNQLEMFSSAQIAKIVSKWWNLREIIGDGTPEFVLFVEGSDDEAIWKAWLTREGLGRRVRVKTGGGMGALAAAKAVKGFYRLGLSHPFPFLLVLDRVENASQRQSIEASLDSDEFYYCAGDDVTAYVLSDIEALAQAFALDKETIERELAVHAAESSKEKWRLLVEKAGTRSSADLKASVAKRMTKAPTELEQAVIRPIKKQLGLDGAERFSTVGDI